MVHCHRRHSSSTLSHLNRERESVKVCVSEDMSPYCSVHDEWLIMKLCMYVGYHDANNVSNFGGDPVTQLNLKKRFIVLFTLFYGHGAL